MIRIGIGGWTYAPWRGTFYPDGLPQKDELRHAAERLGAIEINGTYYRSQSPASFDKWAASVPEGFIFAIKASRYCTNRRNLADGAESIGKFLGQGLVRLGPALGPILWQLMPTKAFDADEIDAFLALLPDSVEGLPLRHALEVRHESFDDPRFSALMRARGAAIVFADSDAYPRLAEQTADFTYARLLQASEDEPEGYAAPALNDWAAQARDWSARGARDVFLFMINGAKVRAPAAAEALIARLR